LPKVEGQRVGVTVSGANVDPQGFGEATTYQCLS
jgi:hypothetical protein